MRSHSAASISFGLMLGTVLAACTLQSTSAPTTTPIPTKVALPSPPPFPFSTTPPLAVFAPTAEVAPTTEVAPTVAVDATAEVARPSNPGGPGQAITLTGDPKIGALIFVAYCQQCHGDAGKGEVSNPGSSDGTVPPLNPIDETLVDKDAKVYASNIDLFIQHGSTPGGDKPALKMPAWGDDGNLTQQQIADIIAYVISLNPAK